MPPEASAVPAPGRARAAWVLFDFANSPFPTLLLTVFGNVWFTQVMVGEAGLELGGVRLAPKTAWGVAMGLSMALVTVTAPFLGRLADRRGLKRAFLATSVAITVAATTGLAFVAPGDAQPAFLLYVLANFAFEGGYVFYNAFLPDVAPPERVGRLSGLAWGLGYAGGLAALLLARPFLPEAYAASEAQGARAIFLLVAAWYLVLSLPTLLLVRDRPPRARHGEAAAVGRDAGAAPAAALGAFFAGLRARPAILWFLAAFFLYNDGITTVIQFTGIYTSEVLAFTPEDNLVLFLVLNVIALPGAIAFGRVQDRLGGRRTIQLTLLVWAAVVVLALVAQTKAAFWPVAVLAATVIGATQSASRALMARLAPRERMGEHMGLLALSGKASAVLGPILYGVLASAFERPGDPGFGNRVALGAIGLFFVGGYVLLLPVRDAENVAPPEAGR